MSDLTLLPLPLRYRPRKIRHLIGQPDVQTQLRGIFTRDPKTGKYAIPQSILIDGPYGTGKTTLARLIAMILNCTESGPSTTAEKVDACGECASCRAIVTDSYHPDVKEINAMSEANKDDIRNIITFEQMAPRGFRKVIIYDEAHGIQGQAASTFLKPYENPSPKTIFILCTNHPEKLLDTLVSRSIRMRLKSIPVEAMAERVAYVAKKEGLKLRQEDALVIAEMAQGHARDAMQMLETIQQHVRAAGKTPDITALVSKAVERVAQASPAALVHGYMKHLLSGSADAIVTTKGVDAHEYFLKLAIQFLMQLAFAHTSPKRVDPYFKGHQYGYGRAFGSGELLALLRVFVQGQRELKGYLIDPQIALDMVTLEALALTQTWKPHVEKGLTKAKS